MKPISESIILNALFPIAAKIAVATELKLPRSIERYLEVKLRLAGKRGVINAYELVALVFVVFLACVVVVLALRGFSAGALTLSMPLLIAPTIVAAWLRASIEERRRGLRRGLMHSLDVLAISVEAGMDFAQAMVEMAKRQGACALGEALRDFKSAMATGLSRREALERMSEVSDEETFTNFIDTLQRAEKLGTGVAAALKRFARMARDERFSRAERAGVVAAQKAILPLVVCIMPATFVIVFGPLLVRVYYGGIEGLLGM